MLMTMEQRRRALVRRGFVGVGLGVGSGGAVELSGDDFGNIVGNLQKRSGLK